MTRRAPTRGRGTGEDPDPAPRAPADETDKRDGFAVTSGAQARKTAAAVTRTREEPLKSQGDKGYEASRASERARADADTASARAASGHQRTAAAGAGRSRLKQK